ncbi:putative AraC family transcriptional regulator [Gordonia effusa NBRC 100432]|uniref:Putative AraC family transcriptional regulator n=1 Tax=Gordonia effusa NBRC 100432 TaxID=1077974 RepID=H0R1A3_9ACTN|nr:AraC family transcriptional regulator [Gordonia effusa]GAB18854.1 putative AraC family transcriptional regulator [Gordonia effusa NBRC 100432]
MIRDIRYAPSSESVGPVELRRIADVAESADPNEFTGTQRLGFELILRIDTGNSTHEVDFARYRLGPGDVLWVHTGQVQRWGDIRAIEGYLLMVNGDALSPSTHALLRQLGAYSQVHWPGGATDSGLSHVFDSLAAFADDAADLSAAREATLTHLATAGLLMLAQASPDPSSNRLPRNDRFEQFRDEVEEHFATDRTVEGYARRLHCSARTLSRLVRDHTGRSPRTSSTPASRWRHGAA